MFFKELLRLVSTSWGRKLRRTCFFTMTLLTLVGSLEGYAFDDPRNSPAIQVPDAEQSLLLDVAMSSKRIVAIGDRGHIVYSDDNGTTWTQAKVPVRVMLTAVAFPEQGRTGWAVGHQGVILVSRDGGLSWTQQLDGNQAHQLMADAYAAAANEKIAELESANEEEREQLQEELENLEFMRDDSIAFVDEGPIRPFIDVWFRNPLEGMAVGSFGLVVRTDDGGQTWYSPASRMQNPEARHYNSIGAHADTLFIAGESGHIQRSFDGGNSWELVEPPYEGSYYDVVVQGSEVLLLGLRGNAFISLDNGDSWSSIETHTSAHLSKGARIADGRYLVSQYSPQLLLLNAAKAEFSPLAPMTNGAISSFLLTEQGALVSVGTFGVTAQNAPNFSVEVQ